VCSFLWRFKYTFCFPSLHTCPFLTSVQTVKPLFVWHPVLPHYFTSLRTHRPLHNLLLTNPQSAAACRALVLRFAFFVSPAYRHTIYVFYNSVFCLGVKLGIVRLERNISTGYSRKGCWGKYLGLRGSNRRKVRNEELCGFNCHVIPRAVKRGEIVG
jgi:hypothetical protein